MEHGEFTILTGLSECVIEQHSAFWNLFYMFWNLDKLKVKTQKNET